MAKAYGTITVNNPMSERRRARHFVNNDTGSIVIAGNASNFDPTNVNTYGYNVLTGTDSLNLRYNGIILNRINQNGMEIYKVSGNNTISVAKFGAETRIGTEGGSRFEVNSGSLTAYKANGNSYFTVSETGLQFGDNVAATTKDIEDIEIGGKNILRGTANIQLKDPVLWSSGNWYKSGTGTVTAGITLTDAPIPNVKGVRLTVTAANTPVAAAQGGVPFHAGTITQSVWVKGTAGDTIRLRPIWANSSSAKPETGEKSFTIQDNKWHKYTFTKDVKYDHPSGSQSTADNETANAGYVYLVSNTVGNSCIFCGDKIEYGNKATDWSQAPEDIQSTVDDAIKSVVSKDQYYLSTSSSSATGGTWQDTVPTWSSGKYIWTRVATTKTPISGSSTTEYSTAVYDSALTQALSDLLTKASSSEAVKKVETTQEYYLSTSTSSATGGSWGTAVPTWASGKYIWKRFKIVTTPISGSAVTTYSPSEGGVYDRALTTALSTANNAAPKSSAIAEEQRIYYRSKVNTKPNGAALPTTWCTNTGNVWNDTATVAATTGWTRKVTPLAKSDDTKYLYLWTCIQKKTVSGTVTYGDILLDDTTTVIDGGNIITGSVTANQIKAGAVTTEKIAAGAVTANKITIGDYNNYVTVNENDSSSLISPLTIVDGWLFKPAANTNAWVSDKKPRWVSEGEEYRVTGIAKAPATGCVVVIIRGRDAEGTSKEARYLTTKITAANTNTVINGTIKINSAIAAYPINNIDVIFCTTDTWTANYQAGYFKQLKVERMSGGSLIVDGAISANKITVGLQEAIKNGNNMLVDWDAPTLTKVNAVVDRYWSNATDTASTPSIVPITDSPDPSLKYMQRYVCDGSNTAKAARRLAFYSTNDATHFTAIPFQLGQKYTLSCWARCTSGSGKIGLTAQGGIADDGSGEQDVVGNTWKRYRVVFHIDTKPSNYYRVWIGGVFLPNTAGTIEVCGCRLVAGVDEEFAAKTATNYITTIDANGIWVTPSGKKPTNTSTGAGATGTKIDTTGVGIYVDGTKLAQYGTTTYFYEPDGTTAATLDGTGLNIKTGTITLGSNFSVTSAGAIKASSGTIGGWSISGDSIYKSTAVVSGTASTQYQTLLYSKADAIDTTMALIFRQRSYDGSAYGSWANNCYVRYDGYLYAKSANITGTINATTGTFGNATNKITLGTGTSGHSALRYGMTTLADTTNNGFYVGTDGIALGKGVFKVTAAGALTATGATINGNTIITGNTNITGNTTIDSTVTIGGKNQSEYLNENIEIGGRNLLIDTDTPSLTKVAASNNRYWSDAGTGYTATFEAMSGLPISGGKYVARLVVTENTNIAHNLTWYSGAGVGLVRGQQYTMSVWCKKVTGSSIQIKFQYGVNSYLSQFVNLIEDNNWHRYSWTFTANSGDNYYYANTSNTRIYIGGTKSSAANEVLLCGFKLEKGNKATDWTPAPEDIDADISAAEKVATNYIAIDSTGIRVASANPSTASQYVHIGSDNIGLYQSNTNKAILTAEGLEIFKGDANYSVAQFGDTIRIGKNLNSWSKVLIDYHSLEMKTKENETFFKVYDLRNNTGIAELTDYFISTSTGSISYSLASAATNATYSIVVSDNSGTISDKTKFGFKATGVTVGATITVTYDSTGVELQAYDIGRRKSGTTTGAFSVIEGKGTTASGYGSHAEGNYTTASGFYSHAEGSGTTASGFYSHAEGSVTTANGRSSHAQNQGTIAEYDFQTAIGKWNDNQNVNAFEIGNGRGDNARSNAFEVTWDGNVTARRLNGVLIGSTPKFTDTTYVAETFNADLTIEPNTTSTGQTLSVNKSGYTPICVCNYYLQNQATSAGGKNVSMCNVFFCNLTASGAGTGTVTYNIANRGSADAIIKFNVTVLYKKN